MHQQLGAVLAELVARSGARAARVVDARTGAVLARAGAEPVGDIAGLVGIAREARRDDDDLVITAPDGVHVLRSLPRAFLHLRTGGGPGVAVARRELASTALHRALNGALSGDIPESRPPQPRHPEPGPVPTQQPALAALAPPALAVRAGRLAVLALAGEPDVAVPLPRRTAAGSETVPHRVATRPLALPTVLQQKWAGDAATMGRILDGLRRLN
jgi:hypothetical protein